MNDTVNTINTTVNTMNDTVNTMNNAINNNDISLGNISNNSIFASEADSTQTETTQLLYTGGRPKEDIWFKFDIINYKKSKYKEAR
ncbi:19410_t:CDS:1, partial [Racocetra persica]